MRNVHKTALHGDAGQRGIALSNECGGRKQAAHLRDHVAVGKAVLAEPALKAATGKAKLGGGFLQIRQYAVPLSRGKQSKYLSGDSRLWVEARSRKAVPGRSEHDRQALRVNLHAPRRRDQTG